MIGGLIGLAALVAVEAAQDNWVALNNDGSSPIALNTSTIERGAEGTTVWMRQSRPEPDESGAVTIHYQSLIQCTERTQTLIAVIGFDRAGARVIALNIEPADRERGPIIVGSVGDEIHSRVCARAR